MIPLKTSTGLRMATTPKTLKALVVREDFGFGGSGDNDGDSDSS